MYRIQLRVITRAKKEEIRKLSAGNYRIKVTSPPEKGRANRRVIELLSREFGVKRQDIKIVSGETTNRKILEINNNLI